MEALAEFLAWSLLIVFIGAIALVIVIGTYMGLKALWNEFMKGQWKYSVLWAANQQLEAEEATNKNLRARISKLEEK